MLQTILLVLILLNSAALIIFLATLNYRIKLTISGIKIALKGQENIINTIRPRDNFNRVCLQYCLLCLRPYIISIMNKAAEREDFEEADACKNIIEEMNKLIQFHEEKDNSSDDNE